MHMSDQLGSLVLDKGKPVRVLATGDTDVYINRSGGRVEYFRRRRIHGYYYSPGIDFTQCALGTSQARGG